MSAFATGLSQAFGAVAGELGLCTTSWIFVSEAAAERGEAGVRELRDELGRSYPVLDAVAASWLAGARAPAVDPDSVLSACAGARHLIVVGIEAAFLDALVPRLGDTRATLLAHSNLEVDWTRVASNYAPHVELVDLTTFQRLAGRRSVLLTFAYGAHGESLHVPMSWQRAVSADVRTQFRGLVAWNTLHQDMYVYPRWLASAPSREFSHIVA